MTTALQTSLPNLEIRSQPQGLVEGYAACFSGIDSYGDTIRPGAFGASLARHKKAGTAPVMLWSHKQESPVGKWTALAEDGRGLVVKGQMNLATTAGREAFEHLRAGDLNGLSIGYRVEPNGSKFEGGVNVLTGIDLHEVSVVTLPADSAARINSVKSQAMKPASIRDFEDALQTLGYSRREAKALCSKGYAGLGAADDSEEIIAAIRAAQSLFV